MTQDPGTFVGDPPRTRWHPAWVVAAALCFASVAITLSIPTVRDGVATAAAAEPTDSRPWSDQQVTAGTGPVSLQ